MKILLKLLTLSLLFLYGCQNTEQLPKKPTVLVTLAPYKYFVKKIAENTVNVHVIIPYNANPHTFEPTPKQMQNSLKARVWFKNGEFLESLIENTIKEKNNNILITDLRKGIDLLDIKGKANPSHDHCQDKHIWLSPSLAKKQAIHIANSLCECFPENASLYQENLKILLKELDKLKEEIEKILSKVNNRSFLVSHSAFTYFCKEFNLNQISTEAEGHSPSVRSMTDLYNTAKELKIEKVIVQPQHNNNTAQLIGKKLHIPINFLDPYSPDYFNNMIHIANTLAK